MRKFFGEKGTALPLALVVVAVFSLLGVLIAHYVSAETKTARQTQYYLQARYLAEGAVEGALEQTKIKLQNDGHTLWGTDLSTFPSDRLIPPQPTAVDISNPNDPNWTGAFKTTTGSSTVWSWVYDGSTFQLKGQYTWQYDTSVPGDSTINWTVGSTTDSYPNVPTGFPNSISFHRTYIGTGQIILPNGSTYTKQIRVGATISFPPNQTPDAPVLISIDRWEDK